MAIKIIDPDLCTGCKICVLSCPMDVIRMEEIEKKATIKYLEDCTVCGWCAEDCPEDAIIITLEKYLPIIGSWE